MLSILSGPTRSLPDRRVHEVFEDQVRARPDAIAAVHADRQLTYRELNARANRLALALLTRGLTREGVVGVVTERNLDWLTAVLAIFKAGGVYLPIEPHFPAERIATMLTRAGAKLVLTEQPLGARYGVEELLIEAAYREDHPSADLGVAVTPDQLAYIYFTSGSTGEPKGAMCEHAGLINHLYAKIDDLKIWEGTVVAQTAPQCFDISLWQLLAALLVGGRVLIVEHQTILDANRFLDKIMADGVNVVQVVPSYLEVLVSCLAQQPRALDSLEYVVATGEALHKELVERWFALQHGVKLVNAYGLTETSDDTNHEIMTHPPREPRVPLGRAINNVRIYIVDELLRPVPLGESGEIVFAGVCVGRGYVNDAERTRCAFLQDPLQPAGRLYRSGDYGRLLPDGKLEFLGRRDSQVKISGFRIEIGEIENRLLQLPGVREAAVVVSESANRGKQLVAFACGAVLLEPGYMRERLGEQLPSYMIPSTFHWRRALPLTENGKTDRKALAALAVQLAGAAQQREQPTTESEQWLAATWAAVLGISKDQIGPRDRFFDLGGTSLSALKLMIALNRALSFQDLRAHPSLREQANLLERRGVRAAHHPPPNVEGTCAT